MRHGPILALVSPYITKIYTSSGVAWKYPGFYNKANRTNPAVYVARPICFEPTPKHREPDPR